MSNVLICDLCGTLVSENTTIDFVRYVMKKQKLRFKQPSICLRALGKILFYFKVDILKHYYVSLLKGLTEAEVELLAQQYVSEKRLNLKVLDLISQRRQRGDKLILCSGSIFPVVKSFAERLKFDLFYSSTLKYKDNSVSGVSKDILFTKYQIIEHHLKSNNSCIITDNYTDLHLLKRCQERFVVIKSLEEIKFWKRKLSDYSYSLLCEEDVKC